MHRRRAEFVLDALEVIEPLDRVVEFRAFLLGELLFHLGNRLGELGPVDILHRGGNIGQHSQALFRHLGEATEHDDLLVRAAAGDGQDTRANRGDDRGVTGEHAEIAFHAGNVDLIDLAGEGELFRSNQIEVEGGHGLSVLSAVTRGLDPRVHQEKSSR